MADIAKVSGHLWPGVSLIADRCCLSVRHTRRLLHELEAEGWLRIVVKRGRKQSGTYVTNDYYLLKPDSIMSGLPDAETPLPDETKPDTEGTETGHAGHPDRTPEAAKPDTAMSAKPSMNPQKISSEPCAIPLRRRPTPDASSANEIIAGFRQQLYAGNGLPEDEAMFAKLIRVVVYAEAKRQIAALRAEETEVAKMLGLAVPETSNAKNM
ncbi:hypothetical protein [Paragemmobacter aquarius]|nr:hypothetical protein [Gemmobacter aquarius]